MAQMSGRWYIKVGQDSMENYLNEFYNKADRLTWRDIYAAAIGVIENPATGERKFIATIHMRGWGEDDCEGEGTTIEEAVAEALEQLKEDAPQLFGKIE
jgi:hypothetical protein